MVSDVPEEDNSLLNHIHRLVGIIDHLLTVFWYRLEVAGTCVMDSGEETVDPRPGKERSFQCATRSEWNSDSETIEWSVCLLEDT